MLWLRINEAGKNNALHKACVVLPTLNDQLQLFTDLFDILKGVIPNEHFSHVYVMDIYIY